VCVCMHVCMRVSVFVLYTTYLKSNVTQMMGLQEKLTYQVGSGSPLPLPLSMRMRIAPIAIIAPIVLIELGFRGYWRHISYLFIYY